jgi:hypothetical protein
MIKIYYLDVFISPLKIQNMHQKKVFQKLRMKYLLQSNNCNIALLGDFNAITKTLDDYVVPDDSFFEVLDDFDNSDLLVNL